ncbi:hypothetical protein CA13_69970 [Planctomycetes bacterium CA13]|uniref:DUF3859 domain-containing protein n=1 Tax=Novipirellula herctigrandis TaxID=2527986 RepID=A0A5C5YNH3_9BACT|nr:hypothetical protein CA13_69970 [Planctomycetes bacterium CA13]
MAKRKPIVRMRSYGLYSHWDAESKELPQFMQSTIQIVAKIGVEFGFVINVKGGKNEVLDYCIEHPGIKDAKGKVRAPFDGCVYVKQNDWNFYLGDTIWEPVDDKRGDWRMFVEIDGNIVAEKTFELI